MQKSKIKVQNRGFGPSKAGFATLWPKLFYGKESIDISLFNKKCYVKKKSLFGQFEFLFIGRLGKVSVAR
jgi:hypothetical protein